MPTRAALPLAALLATLAASPGVCGEPTYLKCSGQIRTLSVDPAKGTRTEEAFPKTVILKLGDADFSVLDQSGADAVWADYCSRPTGPSACHAEGSQVRLSTNHGPGASEVWIIDRATGELTIERTSKVSETGEPYDTRQSFKGRCVTLSAAADSPAPAGPDRSPGPAPAVRPPSR